jgi:hypothetical protein
MDPNELPLKIKLESDQLGVTKQSIRATASFQYSDKPMSFTKRITFTDIKKTPYVIRVSGTTDNSIMTIYSYF